MDIRSDRVSERLARTLPHDVVHCLARAEHELMDAIRDHDMALLAFRNRRAVHEFANRDVEDATVQAPEQFLLPRGDRQPRRHAEFMPHFQHGRRADRFHHHFEIARIDVEGFQA